MVFQRDPNLDADAGKVTGSDAAPVIHLRMQNIMASVNLCTRVDLDKITQTARNAEYNPKRFQAVIMRIREPRTTALIFASGKMIITGARSEEAASIAAKKVRSLCPCLLLSLPCSLLPPLLSPRTSHQVHPSRNPP